jgi:phage terminase large subunit
VFDQLDMRTRLKVITDLNPSDFNCWAYELADGPNSVKIVSTYKDNIKNIPPIQVAVIEGYKDADPTMWKVFGLGLRGTSKDQVYTHWRVTDIIPDGDVIYGLDFGYNNPTALIRISIHDGCIYAQEVIYESKLTTSDLVSRMTGITGSIYCDSAEPKTIEELYRNGFNAYPSDKDVTEGIRKIKSMPLFIHKDSANMIREAGAYKWKLDKNGNVLDEPEKANDHSLDALRYAVFTHLKSPVITWGAI